MIFEVDFTGGVLVLQDKDVIESVRAKLRCTHASLSFFLNRIMF